VSSLLAPVCSITTTKRRRFFWAAWWSAPPTRVPFRKPDASDGGAPTFDEARAAAERAAGTNLTVISSEWARAWIRILRGQPPWPSGATAASRGTEASVPAAPGDASASIWQVLGVRPGVTVTELKEAFRKRALETHPDHGGDPAAFRRLLLAYREAQRRLRRPRRRTDRGETGG
jgi:hypothetical protein